MKRTLHVGFPSFSKHGWALEKTVLIIARPFGFSLCSL